MHILTLIFLVLFQTGCKKDNNPQLAETEIEFPANIATPTFSNVPIETDKATYAPGEEVSFTLNQTTIPARTKVRYKYLGSILEEANLSQPNWSWQLPNEDFKGYIAEIYTIEKGKENIIATIGIDASSSWTKFPRYGFISDYSELNDEKMSSVIHNLQAVS